MEQRQIVIQITNIDAIERSTVPRCRFDEEGGSIGNCAGDHWNLYDNSGGVHAGHGLIKMIDGEFCIVQGSGDVFVNKSSYSLGAGRAALLHDADLIDIGKFNLRVHFTHGSQFGTDPDASLEEVIGDAEQASLLIDQNWTGEDKKRELKSTDPELALAEAMVVTDDLDPEVYFDVQDHLASDRNELSELLEAPGPGVLTLATAPKSHQIVAVSRASKITKNFESSRVIDGVQTMNNDFSSKMGELEDLVMGRSSDVSQTVVSPQFSESPRAIDEAGHLAASPLQRGLNVTLKQSDTAQTHDLLEEIGMTLREAVEGLLKIQQASREQNQGLSNKVLQPIEDNPLRLGLNYQETMAAMFNSDRSMVHLAAPMAVRESLIQIHLHQIATEYATKKALDAILQALNPTTLAARFKRYRGTAQQRKETEEGWAWEMYTHYYEELISSRQQGFEKLYSEVFDQAYDQRLRELQNEAVDDV
ncbi:MAG: hypothetical protein OFPII_04470 [Osedax symbiont Rs1]|nr:MAG: hypothetical protein OFPII_04470 [Osedax symbiont Rs1]